MLLQEEKNENATGSIFLDLTVWLLGL